MNTIPKNYIVGFWLLFILYFAVGGILTYDLNERAKNVSTVADGLPVIFDNIVFKNKAELGIYKSEKELGQIFGWYTDRLSNNLLLVITAMLLSSIGAVFRYFFAELRNEIIVFDLKYFFTGLLSGFILWIIFYFTPNLVLSKTMEFNLNILFIASFLIGFFQDKFSNVLSKIYSTIFEFNLNENKSKNQ